MWRTVLLELLVIAIAGWQLIDGEQCKCGVENNYMFDSGKSSPILYPWMGALFTGDGRQLCGATVISDRHILTAAHCTQGLNASDLKVILGVHNLAKANDEDKYSVASIVVHEKFVANDSVFDNDIGILELKTPLTFSENIHPICRPTENMTTFAHHLNAIGWGQLLPNSSEMAQRLQEIYLPEVPVEKCSEIWKLELGENRLCVGEEMKNVCKGDDGGPLMYNVDNTWYQVGITSFSGPKCGDIYPGVFTRLTYYSNWIHERINGSNSCVKTSHEVFE